MKIRISASKYTTHALALAALFAILLAAPRSQAADATWITNANGDWTNSANWSGGNIPGATNSTSNSNIATFGGSITSAVVVTVDPNRNIGGITFNYDYKPGSAGDGYSLKNNVLLSDGGVIREISTVAPTVSRISRLQNDVYIQGDGGSATIRNDAGSANIRMFLNGVRGVSTSGKTTTLYLAGSNTAPNTFGSVLADGANGGNLAVVKNDSGIWRLSAPGSTYSGGTTLNAGTLQYTPTAAATNSVFGTGTLTLNGGTLAHLDDNSRTITNAITVGGNFSFAARSTATTTFSGNVNLGGATRTITAGGAANSQTILSGVISNGGLTKAGAETLTLQGMNTYTGNTTVSAGTLNLASSGGLTFDIGGNGTNTAILGTGTIRLDGVFHFNLAGADTTSGNNWNIINVGTLSATFGGTFGVDGFTGSSGTWTKLDGGNTWTFKESTGMLNVVPEPSTVALVSLGLGALALGIRRRLRS